jgi:hypothetical protein
MSTNEMQQYRTNSPARSTEVFRTPLPTYSRESRAIARNDRAAVVRGRELANEAALKDLELEFVHQIKLNEMQRRQRRTNDAMHGAAALRMVAETLAQGDPAKALEYNDFYNAWKTGEIYRIVTD